MGGGGGGIGGLGGDILDVGTAIVAPEFLPLAVAGTDLAQGRGVGRSLLGGVEALAGQELAGAVGVGSGNSAFNNALGITGDNPAGTGLPDIGGAISDAASSALGGVQDFLGTNQPAADTVSTTSTPTITPTSSSSFGGTALASPSGVSSSGSIPASSALETSDTQISNVIGDPTASASSTASPGLSPSAFTQPQSASSQIASAPDLGSGASASNFATNTNAMNQEGILPGTNFTGATPASTASTPDTPSTSSSNSSIFKDLIPSGKTLLASAIPLGNLAYQAIKGPPTLPSGATALESGGTATKPLLDLENSSANQAVTGNLTAPQQATINNYIQNAQNNLISQLAQQGVQDPTKDSRYIQGMQEIQQNAIAQAQQYITQAIQTAVSAGGAASGNLAQVANQQIAQDTEFQNALSSAFGSLGSILGGVPNLDSAILKSLRS